MAPLVFEWRQSTTMSKYPFTWLALGGGLLIALMLLGAQAAPDGGPLPLLTQLILAEFGFILNVVGAWLGLQRLQTSGMHWPMVSATLGCILVAVLLGLMGMSLWPDPVTTPSVQ